MSIRRDQRRSRDGAVREVIVVDVIAGPPGCPPTRVTRTPRIQTMQAARQMEQAIIQQLVAGTWGQEVPQAPTLREFRDEFLSNYAKANNKPSEVAAKTRILDLHLVPRLGQLRLDAIGPRDIEAYKARKLDEGLSRKTVNNQLQVLSRALTCAAEWGLLRSAPKVKMLKVPKATFDFLDFGEARRLIDACEGQLRVMVVTLLNTGLRWGELVALQWRDLDLVAGRLMVRRAAWRGHIGTPKGGAEREVPLNDEVRAELKRWRHLRGEWVFCQEGGARLGDQAETSRLEAACKRAGLRTVTWHVLRHTFASHLVMHGVPMKSVQELLGHADIATTMRYAHLSPTVKRDAVQLLAAHAEPTLSHAAGDRN